jgi:hypothetical protein
MMFLYCKQLARREITVQHLESELASVRRQYKEAIEENGRHESRMQTVLTSAHSEQELLNAEV